MYLKIKNKSVIFKSNFWIDSHCPQLAIDLQKLTKN